MDKIVQFLKSRDPMDLLFIVMCCIGIVIAAGTKAMWLMVLLLCIELLRQIRKT